MAAHLLLISEREEDSRFCARVSSATGLALARMRSPAKLKSFLVDHPQTVIFWGADDRETAENYGQVLIAEKHPPVKVFAITDGPLNGYPHLFDYPAFGHHLFRRYEDPTTVLYSKLAAAALIPFPFGIQRFFPSQATVQKITLAKSTQKKAAVEAVQSVLVKHEINSRLAALVAQATDELVMNALFDAPVQPNGGSYRRSVERAAAFDLKDKEQITVEMAVTDNYLGISVADQFGSLKKEIVLSFLQNNYQDAAYQIRKNDPGAGLGLHGTLQAGLSMIFICKPKVRTEVMLLFPKNDSYKKFREGFRFLSILSE